MRLSTSQNDVVDANRFWSVLENQGLVFIHRGTYSELMEFLETSVTWFHHPHEHAVGLTRISPMSTSGSAGEAGFTHDALKLHTDRSTAPEPPSILVSIMDQAAAQGGASVFCDGQAVLRKLRQAGCTDPEIRSLRLAGPGEDLPMWHHQGGRCRLRYRDDAVAGPANSVSKRALNELRQQMSLLQQVRNLAPGEGYVLHNHRFFHGRTAFSGPRSVTRLLANVSANSQHSSLNQGFLMPAPVATR
jgi:alpha-ketoglutarate-dependent taurine dioxygenase